MVNAQENELKITALSKNVYQYTSYLYVEPWGMVGGNGLIVVDGQQAHLIDTPWTIADTKQLLQWLESKELTLKSAIISHSHDDASAGVSLLNELNIATYATALTNKLLEAKSSDQTTQIINTNPYTVLPNSIEVFYPGAGHSDDNIVVWLPKERILFGGCFIKSLKSKTLGNIADASIKQWPYSIEKLIKKYPDINVVVPGHGKAGDMSLLKHTAALALNYSHH